MTGEAPRIGPGTWRELGVVNTLVTRVIGLGAGGRPPNVFLTVGRHRALFRRWLVFAAALMPGGTLRRSESELVILGVAAATDCAYEWQHHARIARRVGVSEEAIERVRAGDRDAPCFTPRERAFLQACHELGETRNLGDATFDALRSVANEVEIIELCFLVGHYQMVAMTLNALRVPLDGA